MKKKIFICLPNKGDNEDSLFWSFQNPKWSGLSFILPVSQLLVLSGPLHISKAPSLIRTIEERWL